MDHLPQRGVRSSSPTHKRVHRGEADALRSPCVLFFVRVRFLVVPQWQLWSSPNLDSDFTGMTLAKI